jgi:16S rRNA (uracil1498-N3)-methyltransferase
VRLRDLSPPAAVIIGPEGGFTPSELEAATRAGVELAGLGPRILRSRTVAAAVAAAVLSRTGDFA